MSRFPQPCVYAVSSRRRLAPDARTTRDELTRLDAWVEAVIEARVDVLQIREADLPARQLQALVDRAVRCAAREATLVLVNDRVDVALAAAAQGVHLPSRGLDASRVRRLEASWTMGRSVHEGDALDHCGPVDYLLFGTVFSSESKPSGAPLSGLEGLARAAASAPCPVIAIGGVTPELAGRCARAGAAGVAAIGLFLPEGCERGALGAARATVALREAVARLW